MDRESSQLMKRIACLLSLAPIDENCIGLCSELFRGVASAKVQVVTACCLEVLQSRAERGPWPVEVLELGRTRLRSPREPLSARLREIARLVEEWHPFSGYLDAMAEMARFCGPEIVAEEDAYAIGGMSLFYAIGAAWVLGGDIVPALLLPVLEAQERKVHPFPEAGGMPSHSQTSAASCLARFGAAPESVSALSLELQGNGYVQYWLPENSGVNFGFGAQRVGGKVVGWWS